MITSFTRTVDPTTSTLVADLGIKNHLRVEHSADDTLIALYASAAYAMIEDYTSWQFLSATYVAYMACFPSCVRLPRPPVASVTHVKYYDPVNALNTFTDYYLDLSSKPAIVRFISTPAVMDKPNAVEITYVSGTTVNNLPANIKMAILLLTGHLYEHRKAVGVRLHELPLGVCTMLDPYRSYFNAF